VKNFAKLKQLDASAPDGMKAFWAFDKAAMATGAIPAKYNEIAEAVLVAAALRAGAAITHGTHAMK